MSLSFEGLPIDESSASPQNEELEQKKKHTSRQLSLAIEANIAPLIREVTVLGKERLEELKPDEKVVIATTHISDLDIPLTIKALADDFDIAVTDDSTHHSFRQDMAGKASIMLAGENNFIPIDYKKTEGGKIAQFNIENFTPMIKAISNGKDIIVAAHNPSKTGQMIDEGVGAVYLAQLARAVILPVAVNIEGEAFLAGKNALKSMLNRPDAVVNIGSPIRLEPIEGIERYKEILDKRKAGKRLEKIEIDEFEKITRTLREQSDIVRQKLAQMLPKEKRGPYSGEIRKV